jgi:hypothetical protein
MYFNRLLSQRIQQVSATFPVLTLTGARQTGKTTLLKHLFTQHHYVSLDLPSEAAMAEHDPEAFFARHPPPVLIDEVQYAPALFRHIKALVDQNRHQFGQFILTGSQKFTLMKNVADSLAGRCVWLELETLSAAEIRTQQPNVNKSQGLLDVLVRGQFPELWRNLAMDHHDFYRSYLATYIERDLRALLNTSNLKDFERFIRLCATYNGQLVNKVELSRAIGVSNKTIDQWLSVLVTSNQVMLLEPYFTNLGKRLIKSPKLYFCDTGLLCYLLGVDQRVLAQSAVIGAVWEAFVFAELRKTLHNQSNAAKLFFYRDQRGLEVDFIIEHQQQFTCLECKWTELPTLKDAKNLLAVAALLSETTPKPLQINHYLVARPAHAYPLSKEVQVIHGAEIEMALL